MLLVYGGLLVPDLLEFTRARRASSRIRTRATCCSTCSCRTRPRWCAREKAMAHIDKLARNTPGVAAHCRRLRAVADLERQRAQPRLDVRHAQGVRAAARLELSADAIAADFTSRCRREVPGAIVTAFGAPPIAGLGTTGGFKLDHRGPRRSRAWTSCSASATRSSPRQQHARAERPVQQLRRRHALAVPGLRPHQVHGAGRGRQRRVQHACRSTWAHITSTTSTSSAGPGRSTSRPTGISRHAVRDILQLQVRNSQGQMVPLGTLSTSATRAGRWW